MVSMSKAKQIGWLGYQDTWPTFEETFQELETGGILPITSNLNEPYAT